jgi:hypothetical protein
MGTIMSPATLCTPGASLLQRADAAVDRERDRLAQRQQRGCPPLVARRRDQHRADRAVPAQRVDAREGIVAQGPALDREEERRPGGLGQDDAVLPVAPVLAQEGEAPRVHRLDGRDVDPGPAGLADAQGLGAQPRDRLQRRPFGRERGPYEHPLGQGPHAQLGRGHHTERALRADEEVHEVEPGPA